MAQRARLRPPPLTTRYPLLLPAAVLATIAVVFVVAGYFSAAPDDSLPLVSDVPVESGVSYVAGRVEAIGSGTITVATPSGSVTLSLALDAPAERAVAAALADLRPGDWINATAQPHQQSIFVLQGIVVIPASLIGAAP